MCRLFAITCWLAACGHIGFEPRPALDAMRPDASDAMPALDAAPAPRLVFLSTTAYLGGSFGGLDDAMCTSLANNAGHSGAYRIVLGKVGSDPLSRLALDQGRPIVRVDGMQVATDATFFTASHAAPIDVDITGATIAAGDAIWTNFTPGGIAGANDCNGWTSGASGNNGGTGVDSGIDATWADSVVERCNRVAHVMCIEQ